MLGLTPVFTELGAAASAGGWTGGLTEGLRTAVCLRQWSLGSRLLTKLLRNPWCDEYREQPASNGEVWVLPFAWL